MQLLGRIDAGLDVYQLGLRKVPKDDPSVTLLQTFYYKLLRQECPPRAVDLFRILPLELITEIISYLQFKDIVKLQLVSKTWRDCLRALPSAWEVLDFLQAVKPPSFVTFKTYVMNSKLKCRSITFHRSKNVNQRMLLYVMPACIYLQELHLQEGIVNITTAEIISKGEKLTKLTLGEDCNVTQKTAFQLFTYLPNLEHVEFRSVSNIENSRFIPSLRPKIRTLVYKGPPRRMPQFADLIDLQLQKLIREIPNVRILRLDNLFARSTDAERLDFSQLGELRELSLRRVLTRCAPPILPPNLHTLNLDENEWLYDLLRLDQLPQTLFRLRNVSAVHAVVSMQVTRYLFGHPGSVRYLDMRSAQWPFEAFRAAVLEGLLSGLEELYVGQTDFQDEWIKLLVSSCPRLRRLDMHATLVTGIGVKALVTSLKGTIEWLGLDLCNRTSKDAVEWARSQGITVSYYFPLASLKGIRVRNG